MKKMLTIFALALTVSVQAQNDTLGVSKFTAIYLYECNTTNAAGEPVTDSMLIAVQSANGVTKSFPYDSYTRQVENKWDIAHTYMAACMHMGDVFVNYPAGRITVQEELYPYRYQTDASLDLPQWTLGDEQDSLCGYLCQSAETKYHGKMWQAYYTEDVPTSIGPWKLGGLPGLITTVKDKEGIHTFTLCGLLNEEQPLVFTEYITWIVPERSADGKMKFVKQRVDYQKMKASKFLKHKAKMLNNPRYVQNPTYYAPNAMDAFGYQETRGSRISDRSFNTVAGVIIPTTVNAYQPLELK
ncbi:MAG: GLPGLI family protein [Bacteroidaceae bacterium]|nr:GLPGLI family protein [Bacteroidaceae bacterium]